MNMHISTVADFSILPVFFQFPPENSDFLGGGLKKKLENGRNRNIGHSTYVHVHKVEKFHF